MSNIFNNKNRSTKEISILNKLVKVDNTITEKILVNVQCYLINYLNLKIKKIMIFT